ncbi:unnamed protein product, partial [Rotaria magnacalcarata]
FAEKYNAPEATLHERPLVPEFYVSFPSRILYSWVTPLILRGYRKPLTEKDCWELPMSERTVTVVDQVRNYMKGLLLNYFTDLNKPKWLGVFYASLLSIVVFCQIILLRAYFHCQFLVGLQFRSAITGLIYRKSLKLSNASKQETTTGEIVNLMAIDASRFAEVTQHIHVLWSGPLQLLIALILLYREMKFSIIPGVTLLFIMIPTNLYLHQMQKKLTFKQMKIKDQRIKMMSEILNGIRVLKLYAWEVAFIRSITRIRDKELEYIRKKAILTTISNILWTFTPIL